MKSGNFFAELKRRNVIRMGGLYLVGAWLVVQVAGTVLPSALPKTVLEEGEVKVDKHLTENQLSGNMAK
jgi:hypothetical protein